MHHIRNSNLAKYESLVFRRQKVRFFVDKSLSLIFNKQAVGSIIETTIMFDSKALLVSLGVLLTAYPTFHFVIELVPMIRK